MKKALKILLLITILFSYCPEAKSFSPDFLYIFSLLDAKLIKRLVAPMAMIGLIALSADRLEKKASANKVEGQLLTKDLKMLILSRNRLLTKSFDQQYSQTIKKIGQTKRTSKFIRIFNVFLKVAKSALALIIISLISNHVLTKDTQAIVENQTEQIRTSQESADRHEQSLNALLEMARDQQRSLEKLSRAIDEISTSLLMTDK